ncbi:hypothetical protein B484DRAFT_158760 [Ochromonadaceae sp. CCMP2298]|nr:hypothetical protein B484DRAFT_158760 [Ochromonadaceae sp. CCMP2298]
MHTRPYFAGCISGQKTRMLKSWHGFRETRPDGCRRTCLSSIFSHLAISAPSSLLVMLSLFLPSLSLCIMFSRLSSVMSLSPLRTHIRTRIVSNPTSGTSLASFSKDYTSPADYLKSIYNLEGKTAIVTGATGGIGAAVAEGLWMAGNGEV